MKWEKAPEELKAKFDAAFPPAPAERKQMFGYPCGFVNGNMFAGIFGSRVFVRVSDAHGAELAGAGGEPFEPMKGRPMKGYTLLPAPLVDQPRAFASWTARAAEHTATLPPKAKKRAKPPPKSKAKAARKR